MFDIGWAEMGVIALVTLVVMGPKELPNALRTFAYWVKKVRGMAREFQSGVDQLIREAELDEAKKKLQGAASLNLNREIQKVVDPEKVLDKALALPAEPKAVTSAGEPKSSPPAAESATTTEPQALPSAEVKPFPVPGVPGSGAAPASGLRPNGNAAAPNGTAVTAEAGAGVALGAVKPAATTTVAAEEGEDAPSRKAQSG